MDDGGGAPFDTLLGGALRLRQPPDGHRAGTDAVLLAAATGARPGQTLVDLGSGVGSVGLAVALRVPGLRVRLVEIGAPLAALAAENATLNGVGDRAAVRAADVLAERPAADERGDWVVSNPPFGLAGQARPSPDPLRLRAHELPAGRGHGDWLTAMLRWARPRARLAIIHRPDAVPALLAAAAGRLGGLVLLPVLPREGAESTRVLLGGIVGSRAPLRLLAPLVLHGPDGAFTPRAEGIHRGAETLDLLT